MRISTIILCKREKERQDGVDDEGTLAAKGTVLDDKLVLNTLLIALFLPLPLRA